MTTYNHTVIATGAAANAATINSPLAELDAAIKKNEYAKATGPGVNDDSGDGYSVGSLWINSTDDMCYICVDATAAAAKWYRIDAGNYDIVFGAQDFYIIAGSPSQGVLGLQPTWRLDSTGTETIGASTYFIGPTGGSTIEVRIIWCMESATVNDVYFTIRASAIDDTGGDATDTGSSSSAAITVPGTAKITKQTGWNCSETYTASDLIRISISRIGGNGGDTAAGDCHILGAFIRFK